MSFEVKLLKVPQCFASDSCRKRELLSVRCGLTSCHVFSAGVQGVNGCATSLSHFSQRSNIAAAPPPPPHSESSLCSEVAFHVWNGDDYQGTAYERASCPDSQQQLGNRVRRTCYKPDCLQLSLPKRTSWVIKTLRVPFPNPN